MRRAVSNVNAKSLKCGVEAYTPVYGVKYVNVLLIGAVGGGKSNYFNTINSIFTGHVTAQACSGSSEHSLTTQFRKYHVRSEETRKTMKFRLCDTLGLEDDQGVDTDDINAMLDGHLCSQYTFNPAAGVSSDSVHYNTSPSLQDCIHCVAFVVDVCTVDVFSDKVLRKMKYIQTQANQRGIPQVVVLTKVDKVCKEVADDPQTIFSSKTISDLVDKTSEMIGLPRSHVLPVKNYEQELELNDSVDVPVLVSLRQILRFADNYLNNFQEEGEEGWGEVVKHIMPKTTHSYMYMYVYVAVLLLLVLIYVWSYAVSSDPLLVTIGNRITEIYNFVYNFREEEEGSGEVVKNVLS